MVCRNEEHGIAVKIEKKVGAYFGKLQDIPMDLFSEISRVKNREYIIKMIIGRAENARGDCHLFINQQLIIPGSAGGCRSSHSTPEIITLRHIIIEFVYIQRLTMLRLMCFT